MTRAALRKKIRNRKYGLASHKRAKREFAAIVRAGFGICARCGEPIAPDEPFDVGHDDVYPDITVGPEHRSCNRGAPHRNVTSRKW